MRTDANDFASISPSAKALLFLKSRVGLPYAQAAARLVFGEMPPPAAPIDGATMAALKAKARHFAWRYQSLGQLTDGLGLKNFLELSSGFSFRGLDLAQRLPVHYLDTDLPELIATKRELLLRLREGQPPLCGALELLPLNALDTAAFEAVAARLPAGPLLIINEGLLMYLDAAEKQQCVRNIARILRQRGGYWITADIYVKSNNGPGNWGPMTAAAHKFYEEHQIEAKKFESFEAARAFFHQAGFVIDLEAQPSAQGAAEADSAREQIQATWRLRLA